MLRFVALGVSNSANRRKALEALRGALPRDRLLLLACATRTANDAVLEETRDLITNIDPADYCRYVVKSSRPPANAERAALDLAACSRVVSTTGAGWTRRQRASVIRITDRTLAKGAKLAMDPKLKAALIDIKESLANLERTKSEAQDAKRRPKVHKGGP